jgi:phenylpyruvate tautomerase PptA (4-oxalocrotonate tautomerase family)
VGRSVKVKKQIVAGIVDKLSSQGFDPELVMVCFSETRWENWSFGGGRFLHA